MTASPYSDPPRPPRHRYTPARVAGVYLVFGLAWVWLSDLFLIRVGMQGEPGFWAAAAKGSAFVLVSAGALYWLVRREVRDLTRAIGLLNAVAEGTTDAVFVKDRDGKYLLFNGAAARFVGRPVAEVLGRDATELFDPRSAAVVLARDRAVMDSGRVETQEEELTAAGVTRTYLSTKAPYRDAAGAVVGVVGVARDVTDRERAEAERLAHLRFFESMDRVNRALHETTDLDRTMSAVLDLVLAELQCDRAWLVHPCDPDAPTWAVPMERTRPEYPGAGAPALAVPADPETARVMATALGAGGPVQFGPGADPLPAGVAERFGIRSQLATAVYPLSGPPWMFGLHQCSHARVWSPADVRLFQEIGRRLADALTGLLAYRNLRTSEERYRALVEMAPEAIALVRDGRVAFANAATARMVGAPDPGALIGLTINDYLHPDDLPASEARQRAVLRDGRVLPPHDLRLRRLDGTYIDIETCSGPCLVDGAPGIQLIARDVTARKRAAALLAHQTRVLERIATGAPLAESLGEIVQFVEEQLPGAVCSILLLDRDGQRLRHGAAPSLPPAYTAAIDGVVIGPRVGSCGTAAYTRETVHVADIATDPLWADYKGVALAHGLRACWSTPIFGAARGAAPRAVLGTFAVYARDPGAPEPRFAELIGRAEHLASVAIESDRAERELRERAEALRQSHAFREAVIRTAGEGLCVCAPVPEFPYLAFSVWNDRMVELTGYTIAEINRLGWYQTLFPDPELRDRVAARMARMRQGDDLRAEEWTLTRRDGERRVVAISTSIVEREDGIPAVVALMLDITERTRTELALRASEERFRAYVDHAADGLVLHDARGAVVDANAQACASLGYTRDELIGMTPAGFDPDVTPKTVVGMLERLAAGETVVFDSRHRRKDGTTFPVEVRIRPFQMNGTRWHLALARDITERKRAEESLQASEERYRDLVELSPEGVSILHEGRFVYVNRSGGNLIGLTPSDLVGRALAEFLHPDDHAASRDRQGTVTQKGQSVPLRQFRVRHADGTWRIVEACAGPCRFEGKAAVQIISRDATERIQAEQALREREEQLRTFVDHVWAPIAMFDRDMRYIHISRRWLTDFGLGDRDIIGHSHYEVFPEIPDRWKDVHNRCLAGTVERCEEDRFERADGTVQWLRWEIQPWRRADGAVGGLVMFSEDITARKRMEARYQQAQKMEAVGRLAGGIAHDFNNLLTVINGFTELTLRDLPVADPHRGALAHVRGAGDRAARLTQQLLAYGRKAVIEPKVLDLNEVIEESARMLRPLVGEDVTLATVFRPGGAQIRADRGHIEQVLMNLVVNARDAMPAGGRITATTETVALGADQLPDDPDLKPGWYVRLTVADTGVGMTDEVRANIFEPFFTTKGVGQGTGLGLAVVQGAVKQSGGHVEVASAPGAGTTFTLLFPSVADRAGPALDAPDATARGTETVLLVEDEDEVRAIARMSLEAFGYTVVAVASGAEALRAAERHAGAIGLLVTDVVMPEMGGRELAEALRRREPGLRALFMSGYTDDVVVRHGLTAATDAFIQKPFTPQALAHKVRAVLDRGG